jgi:hypothetical protein
MRSSIACVRCRRSKVKCVNTGPNTTCRACDSSNRECTYPQPVQGGTPRNVGATMAIGSVAGSAGGGGGGDRSEVRVAHQRHRRLGLLTAFPGAKEGETEETFLKCERSAYRCQHEYALVLAGMFGFLSADPGDMAANCTGSPLRFAPCETSC